MYDNMLSLNESMVTLHACAGQSPHRGRPRNAYPRGAYQASDGYIALNIPDERIWQRFADVMGQPELKDDPRTCSGPARTENRDYLDPLIEDWLRPLTRAEAVDLLNDAGIPAGPVYAAEDVFSCPQVAARGSILAIDDSEVGEYRFARTQPVLSAAPDIATEPAPALGQHSREILEQMLGYDSADVDGLIARGVVEEPSDSG